MFAFVLIFQGTIRSKNNFSYETSHLSNAYSGYTEWQDRDKKFNIHTIIKGIHD